LDNFVFICVVSVCQDYDADKKFPAYMFGAKPTKDEMVNQYFPLNYQVESPSCDGVDGILESYYEALKKGVSMSTLLTFT
jgi:hypothetical protein